MGISRNNHYIPRMYLSRWAVGGRIYVYRLLVSNESVPYWSVKSIEHTGSLMNLYVSVRNSEEFDSVERHLANEIESPAKGALDKICNDAKMNTEDWSNIGDYVLAQLVRTPYFYYWVKEFGIDVLPKTIDGILDTITEMDTPPCNGRIVSDDTSYLPIGVHITDHNGDESFKRIEVSAVAGKGLWLFAINHALNKQSPLKAFFRNMKWSVVDAPVFDNWPSCDNPVVVCDTDGDTIMRCGLSDGIIKKSKAIVFPVSPKKTIVGMQSRVFDWHILSDNKMAFMIKRAILSNAMLYIYAQNEDKDIPGIRPRIVDEEEYKRIDTDFSSWFENYKEIEGPLLRR